MNSKSENLREEADKQAKQASPLFDEAESMQHG